MTVEAETAITCFQILAGLEELRRQHRGPAPAPTGIQGAIIDFEAAIRLTRGQPGYQIYEATIQFCDLGNGSSRYEFSPSHMIERRTKH